MSTKTIALVVLAIVVVLIAAAIFWNYAIKDVTDPDNPVQLGGSLIDRGDAADNRVFVDSVTQVTGPGTSEDNPLYVQVLGEVPPTIPPTPHGHDPDTERVRLARHYDTIEGFADARYQIRDRGFPFVYNEFTVAATVSNDGWHIVFPECVQTAGYPWTRYAFGWPERLGGLIEINIGGLNQINSFVEQQNAQFAPLTLGDTDDPLEVWVGIDRFDCRVLAGQQAILKEEPQ